MSKITKCLRDPCELVRRQTFILLGRLLQVQIGCNCKIKSVFEYSLMHPFSSVQRDYVKWRGLLFLRFLLCLVDDSEKIKQLADFLFGNILKGLRNGVLFLDLFLYSSSADVSYFSAAKAPLLAYNSFVESIFVLNDCNAHTGRSNPSSSHNENRLFTIRYFVFLMSSCRH